MCRMMLDYVERCENMKKKLLIIGIVICVLIALFYLFVISGAFLMLTYFAPNPPKPEITYAEFMKLLTSEEKQLFIILQAHGLINPSAHSVMSLNKILKRHYNNECITIDEITDSISNCQKESNEKLKILRM